ncbi:MAG: nickel-dependent lactate racemase [Clostridiales bacterium]|nr:nickel-dependent lactate racemase [Clostridiales bacterium]
MEITLGFCREILKIDICEKNLLGVLEPNPVEAGITGVEEVRRALCEPIGSKKLKDIVKHGEKIAIITSDITRPMPSQVVLPEILSELSQVGSSPEDITVVFAMGNHRKHTEEEKIHLVGEDIYKKIRCIDSDQADCVNLGKTSYGTPVDIFRTVAEADRRICLGNIEYHYFAGYSGGAKAIMPGVSTKAAIQENHSRMVMPQACTGRIKGNPVREDIDEVADFVPIDFILNVVLDEKKNIIKAMAGHYIEAHREGCLFLDRLYKVKIRRKADIVLVSPGGYPKDINLYQAQKALDNAGHAVRDGGIIILAASCDEGLGEEVFERWMLNAESPAWMVDEIKKRFELGGHKAAAIGMVLQSARIFLVSHMHDEFVKSIFMEPFGSVEDALAQSYKDLGPDSGVLVMPYGGSTLPLLEEAG